jgi:uncharacterized protein with HEPN domain
MSKDKQRLVSYLQHILSSILRIDEYIADIDELGFLNSNLIQDAVIRNLEIIGEASNNIEKHFPSFSDKHPAIPLSSAYQMRNAIAHGYFKVDYEIVWNTIESYLPELYQQIDTVLQYYLENDIDER